MKVRVTKLPPSLVAEKHGIELGQVHRAEKDTDRNPPARGQGPGELKFPGAVWVIAPKSTQSFRLLADEWVEVMP